MDRLWRIILGAAFGAVVKSLVDDIVMPVVSSLTGAPDFSNLFLLLRNPTGLPFTSVAAARAAGASVFAVGLFVNALIAFLLVASVYLGARAVESGRLRWLVGSAVLIGLAFNTKMLVAMIVVPGIALAIVKDGKVVPLATVK